MVKGGGFRRSRAKKKLAFNKGAYAAKGLKAYKRNAANLARRIVRRELNKNIETKQSNYTSVDGVEIFHNNFISLDNTLLETTQGIQDPQASSLGNRIGDKISLRGVKLKGMVELNERYCDVTIRILVVKCAKGDIPTRATLFNGLSGNKMLDTVNKERYTVLAQKYLKLKAPNRGDLYTNGAGGPVQPSGFADNQTSSTFSRATKMWKMWLPGKKFSKSGNIIYEDGTSQVKFFDYKVLMYAYSNQTTGQDLWYVARNNDYIKTMYFKDA